MSTPLALVRLIELVCPRGPEWPAAEHCCAALREAPIQSLGAGRIERAQLLRIYEFRLRRNPDAVLGAERLLSDLRSYSGGHLMLAALELKGHLFCMLFDDAVTQLVTCFVGDDRRWRSLAD